MNRKDFMQLLWVMPFLGGFIAFIIASLFQTGEAALGIMVMLGVLAGIVTLLTYISGIKYVSSEEKIDASNKTKES